jgi:hypothetical protein
MASNITKKMTKKDNSNKHTAGPKTTGLALNETEAITAPSLVSPSPLKRQKITPGSGFSSGFSKKFNSLHYEEMACGSFVAHFEKSGADPYWIPTKFKVKSDEVFRARVKIDSFLPMCNGEGGPIMTKPDSNYKWEQMICYSPEGEAILPWAKNIARIFNQHGCEPKVYKYGFKCQLGKNRTGQPKKRTLDLVAMDNDVVEIFKKAYGIGDNADLSRILKDGGIKAEIETFFRNYDYGKQAIDAYLMVEDPFYVPSSDEE